ncbi:MAG: hypothetical protein JXN60_02430 [Lentisphaerae bacterium]|nr:hypothetical protein [Lentisphaerota bacterium]
MLESDISILEIQTKSKDDGSRHESDLQNMSLTVAEHDIVLIQSDLRNKATWLLDMAQGLTHSDHGSVSFMGVKWGTLTSYDDCRLRSRIGRVYDQQIWISNLDVYENIALSELHHTNRCETEIREEIVRLAERMSLRELLTKRPADLHENDLQLAQWVRAFIGSHKLILMSRPEAGVSSEDIQTLIDIVFSAVSEGSGVIWTTTSDERIWRHPRLNAVRRFRILNEQLISVMEGTGEDL